MCGGGKEASPPPNIRLHTIDPGPADSSRPKTQSRRPPSSQKVGPGASSSQTTARSTGSSHRQKRPSTSGSSSRHDARPSSSSTPTRKDVRPSTSSSSTHKDARPGSSSNRPRTSSTVGHTSHRQSHTKRRARFDAIPENTPVQYTEDKTIINSVAELHTLIDQHAENFYYLRDGFSGGGSGDSALDDPATRHGIIRYRIARTIIDEIIMSEGDSSNTDIQNIATRLSTQLTHYAIPESSIQRESHIYELCNLGAEIWRLMASSPSTWEFGDWDEPQSRLGFIMVFPTLLQDEEQAAPRRIFRI